VEISRCEVNILYRQETDGHRLVIVRRDIAHIV